MICVGNILRDKKVKSNKQVLKYKYFRKTWKVIKYKYKYNGKMVKVLK